MLDEIKRIAAEMKRIALDPEIIKNDPKMAFSAIIHWGVAIEQAATLLPIDFQYHYHHHLGVALRNKELEEAEQSKQ